MGKIKDLENEINSLRDEFHDYLQNLELEAYLDATPGDLTLHQLNKAFIKLKAKLRKEKEARLELQTKLALLEDKVKEPPKKKRRFI